MALFLVPFALIGPYIHSIVMSYLCKHWLSMVCDHECLVTVECDGGVVERLFRVAQYEVKVRHTTLKYTAEVTRDEGATNSCK